MAVQVLRGRNMQKICSWCKIDLGTVSTDSYFENAISHGICTECVDTFFGPHRVKLVDFIDSLNAAVVVVDAAGSIISANKQARVLLHKDMADVVGLQGGEVFECAYAKLPEGCGNTTHCDGCTIRNTVMDSFLSGKSHLKKPAYLIHGTPDNNQEVQFLISTEKVNDVVLLRIDKF